MATISYTDQLLEKLAAGLTQTEYLKASRIIEEFKAEKKATYEKEEKEKDRSILWYGKYKGKSIEDVKQFDIKYLEWISRQTFIQKSPQHLELILEALRTTESN